MITKGNFKDGTTGWKAVAYDSTKKIGFSTHEIHHSDDGECVAEVVHGESDAMLIAAAPELLDALRSMLKAFGGIADAFDEKESKEKAEKAILKATGEIFNNPSTNK